MKKPLPQRPSIYRVDIHHTCKEDVERERDIEAEAARRYFCRFCGAEVSETQDFCKCGRKAGNESFNPRMPKDTVDFLECPVGKRLAAMPELWDFDDNSDADD